MAKRVAASGVPNRAEKNAEPLFRTMKEKGVTSYRLGKLGFPLSNFYAMKHGDNVSTHTINQLCRLLQCRVEDVMEYIDEE